MMTPPIVGVPCFTRWLSGPSARTCWPMWLDFRNRIHAGMSAIGEHHGDGHDGEEHR